MKHFPSNIAFKYPWRKYQQRVLEELSDHLSDKHLHVIAPPGSGKTVLGLEVMLRLNEPVLILAPTIAIRNQWIQRFCELFLQSDDTPNWISRDIRNPAFMTVSTYQGLHAACSHRGIEIVNDDEKEETQSKNQKSASKNLNAITKGLLEKGVKTIVLDEAHHLKNEWWATLTAIKEKLDPVIVGLTATPPYDVTGAEWQRYTELNGPVDTEITVPELIIEGDLCPHQDYIYFTLPTDDEKKGIDTIKYRMEKLFEEVKNDLTLIEAIKKHPAWLSPKDHLDWIYSNVECYSAMLIFLNTNNIEIPRKHIEIVTDKNDEIPTLDYGWMETLLDFYLYREKEHFTIYDEHRLKCLNKLKSYGAMERRKVTFSNNSKVDTKLILSISKLNAIESITNFEHKQLGNNLRMVILTDYIRKEFYVNDTDNNGALNKIGVLPIFEKLRRKNINNKKIGVLSGSFVIIPKSALPQLEQRANEYNITINSTLVPFDDKYVLVNQTEQIKHYIVQIVTDIFEAGEIEVLIGTKSLLGEGWDAPAINSLILASFVGSFVLSNQMRGRAIRTQQGNENKTGNIWHLVCIDPESIDGGRDLQLMKRRFKGFVGVSYKEENGIENGLERLQIPDTLYSQHTLNFKNDETFKIAAARDDLKTKWDKALTNGVNLVEEIKIPFHEAIEKTSYQETKRFHYNKTITHFTSGVVSGILAYSEGVLNLFGRSIRNIRSLEQVTFMLSIVGVGGIFFFGSKVYKSLRLYIGYKEISKDIEQISNALLHTLHDEGHIQTHFSDLNIVTNVDNDGTIHCYLEGGSTYEKSIFMNSLAELIGPIDNPRYVIIRTSRLLFIKQKDYHSVPEILSKTKKPAQNFELYWRKYVGHCHLVFTRNQEGRELLVKSRTKALISQLDDEIEQVSKWR
ncbi:MAG: restriction endonuclease subunit R [Flavobacterium sp. MedPE-SWcel]|uniref:DEAD/DEAH box helicase family protein n=1 Tax=uncultured Flavobacterium sp. TaxID=165435 RepID=UPI0009166F0C|nr:DEAD/DEAH box helicase family protein [uncultured Flavobacterium sp.]OIQ22574.1 MAG: restriction endonuclease subunit R [Flavobacterium sp. MedPE-SWcel]